MKIHLLLLWAGITLFPVFTHAQECKSTYAISITNSKTKKVFNRTATVALKSGWQMWLMTDDASFKTAANRDYIFAVVYLPSTNLILKAFKGNGSFVYWSDSSPFANCDELLLIDNFPVTDIEGNKGIIRKTSF